MTEGCQRASQVECGELRLKLEVSQKKDRYLLIQFVRAAMEELKLTPPVTEGIVFSKVSRL